MFLTHCREDPLRDEILLVFDDIDRSTLGEILSLGYAQLPDSLNFRTRFIDLNDSFYCDEDDISADVFENILIKERIQEKIEDDLNPNIYHALDVIGL